MTAAGELDRDQDEPPEVVADDEARSSAPLIVFVAVEIVAFGFYAFVGRHVWFSHDELVVLAGRHLNASDLLQDWGGHWITLPIAVNRLWYWAFGLRSVFAYQVLTIGLHLTAAALLRTLMRRAGVGPWAATAVAFAFVCFGSGGGDILETFQTTFDGALVLGLAQMLLADHGGTLDRRDVLGVVCGLAAIMCSNVAIATVVAVGVATTIRRGWRIAAFHVLPLAGIYLAWWSTHRSNASMSRSSADIIDWVWRGTAGLFGSLGQIPGVGWLLAAMFVSGLVIGWRQLDATERWRRASLPIAYLVAGIVFEVTLAIARVNHNGIRDATLSRYVYIFVALLMVPIAVAVNALARRQRQLGIVAVALLLVGVPGNLTSTADNRGQLPAHSNEYRKLILSLPRMDVAQHVPSTMRPLPHLFPEITVGWLLDGVRSGRFPRPPRLTPRELLTNRLRLSIEELHRAPSTSCAPLPRSPTLHLSHGEAVGLRGTVAVQLVDGDLRSESLLFGVPLGARTLIDVGEPLTLHISSGLTALCSQPGASLN